MNELFAPESVASKSPRLRWMEGHDVHTKYRRDLCTEAGRWEAWVGEYDEAVQKTFENSDHSYEGYPSESPFIAWDGSEDDAIIALAKNNGWRLWHEENFATKK